MVFGMEHKTLELSKISLDLENPRHKHFHNQDEVITYLCDKEKIIPLAEDIAENGLNPLELLAVIKRSDGSFFCAEGNRRICALKLLENPTLAPDDLREYFIKASENMHPLEQLNVVEFKDRDEVQIWLNRIHAGPNKGVGRVQWNSLQKVRNDKNHKGRLALSVLDYAQEIGLILSDDLDGLLSTIINHLSNPHMRDALGLIASDTEPLTTDLSDADFKIVFKKFIEDVAAKNIDSWTNKDKTETYANELIKTKGFRNKRVVRRDLIAADYLESEKVSKPLLPSKPKKQKKITASSKLAIALKEMPSPKLENIYYSLCSIALSRHTPLLSIGASVFIEILTAECGRKDIRDGKDGKNFKDYLDAQQIAKLLSCKENKTKSIQAALARIYESGNTTKHHKTATNFDGDQLANDFQTIDALLIALAKEAKKIKEAENTDP